MSKDLGGGNHFELRQFAVDDLLLEGFRMYGGSSVEL